MFNVFVEIDNCTITGIKMEWEHGGRITLLISWVKFICPNQMQYSSKILNYYNTADI